jgi:ribose/xylose/arabinose/galactoside ABC-type transport system permease subunit
LLALCVVLWILTPYFLTVSNLLNIAEQTAIIAIVATGMTFVIITAGIDLSVGSVLAFSGVVMASLLQAKVPLPLALVVGIAVGFLSGTVNGLLITLGRLPPFIATLGMMSVARGAALLFTEGRPNLRLFQTAFVSWRPAKCWAFPMPVIVMLAVYAIAYFLLTRNEAGRYTYAIGGNEEATILSGVNVKLYKTLIYGICGGLSGLAGDYIDRAFEFSAADCRHDVRVGRDCGNGHRWHQFNGRRGQCFRHVDRGVDYWCAQEWLEFAEHQFVHAANRHRPGHHCRGAFGYDLEEE